MSEKEPCRSSKASIFETIRRNNGHVNIAAEALGQTFSGAIKTPEDVRDFVVGFEAHIEGELNDMPEGVAKAEARERVGSLVGQVLGLNTNDSRSYFWLRALDKTEELPQAPQFDAVKIAYTTYSSIRTR